MPKTRRNDSVAAASAAAAAAGGGNVVVVDDDEPPTKRQRTTSSSRSGSRRRRHGGSNDDEVVKQAPSKDVAGADDKDDGDGGFTLQLANHKQIRVSAKDSQQLQDSCAFFRNAFRHGTMECQNHIISKPDWTISTATSILQLIKNGTLSVPTTKSNNSQDDGFDDDDGDEACCSSYSTLKEAADQILLPLRILHPVSGSNIENDTALVQSIADTWKQSTTTFTMDMSTWVELQQQQQQQRRNAANNNARGGGGGGRNIVAAENLEHQIWEDLLFQGTVFVDHDHQQQQQQQQQDEERGETNLHKDNDESNGGGLQIQLIPDNPVDVQPLSNGPANILRVGCFGPLAVSVFHTTSRLSEKLRNPRNRPPSRELERDINQNKPACMAFPLYTGAKSLLEERFPDLQFLLIETNTTPTLQMTRITAEPHELRRVLEVAVDYIAPVHLHKLCYLLIPEPPIQVLGKLISACQEQCCVDNPNTIGWDIEKNQFCTLKTIRDTKLILDALSHPSTKIATEGNIKLINVDMTSAPQWSSY